MTEPLDSNLAAGGELQFDNAEYTAESPGPLTCAACSGVVSGTYYEANGKVICDACREKIEAHRRGGSGLVRFARAFVFGSLAALAGYGVYFGVMKATGWQVGLISILVGLMVGSAVRAGSRHRGGLVYQLLAVFLTYSVVVATYASIALPFWMAQMSEKQEAAQQKEIEEVFARVDKERARKPGAARTDADASKPEGAAQKDTAEEAANVEVKDSAKETGTGKDTAETTVAAKERPAETPTALKDKDPAVASAPGDKGADAGDDDEAEAVVLPQPGAGKPVVIGPAMILFGLAAIVGILYAFPIYVGVQSPISLLIVGFAVWEAWKLNRRVALVFNGPYDAGAGSIDPAPVTELPSDV